MALIGITGGIGSGKSYFCQRLEVAGFPVFYTDLESKKLLLDTTIQQKLIPIVGDKAFPEGKPDKTLIANQIFGDADKKAAVDAILHPAVLNQLQDWCKQHTDSNLLFVESALLFDCGMDTLLSETVVITAPLETRIERVIQRNHTTHNEVEARIKAQMSQEEMIKKATHKVCNGPQDDLNAQLLALLKAWCIKYGICSGN